MYDVVKELCQLYFPLMLLLGAGVLIAWRRKQLKRGTACFLLGTWFGILLLSLPVVSYLMLGTLEWLYPQPKELPNADVIVVLGGGVLAPDQYRESPIVSGSSYGRSVHALGLQQKTGAKLLLCGGYTDPSRLCPSEAQAMHDLLVDLGADSDSIVLEERSTTTSENARYAAEAIKSESWDEILLVTTARHMPRSVLSFQNQGIRVIPAACGYKTGISDTPWMMWCIPNTGALDNSNAAIREWIGLAWYKLRGRI